MSTPHFHVYGRTRPPVRRLETLSTWRTRKAAVADMQEYRQDFKNGLEMRGCVSFTVSKYACNCPEPSYMFNDNG